MKEEVETDLKMDPKIIIFMISIETMKAMSGN